MTNNFYDKSETLHLGLPVITVAGETSASVTADLSALQKRSVMVKEAFINGENSNLFRGAYRYDGYSLFDILNTVVPEKSNREEFGSVIDLYAEIGNKDGERVVLSWGEIFYPSCLHRIIIATDVSRIVPTKTGDLWPLPQKPMIVAAGDLLTERNIPSPDRITIRSFRRSFPVTASSMPPYSPSVIIYSNGKTVGRIADEGKDEGAVTFNTVFYGRGRGIHSTKPFTGVLLKNVLQEYYPLDRHNIMHGLLCIAGTDGYRCVLSFSELFNRNDQQEFLLVKCRDGEGGKFRIFPSSDFFSDRAVKSVSEIHFENYA